MIYRPGDTITITDWANHFPNTSTNSTSLSTVNIADVLGLFASSYTLNSTTGAYDYSHRGGSRPANWQLQPVAGGVRLTVPDVFAGLDLRDRIFVTGQNMDAPVDVDTLSTGEKQFCCTLGGTATALYSATSDGHSTKISLHAGGQGSLGSLGSLAERDVRAQIDNLFEPALSVDAHNVLWLTGLAIHNADFERVRHRLLRSPDGGRSWEEREHPKPLHDLIDYTAGGTRVDNGRRYLAGYMANSIRKEARPFVWMAPSSTLYLFSYSSEALPTDLHRPGEVRMGLWRNRAGGRNGAWQAVTGAEVNWSHQDMRSIQGREALMDGLGRRFKLFRLNSGGAGDGLQISDNYTRVPAQAHANYDLSPLSVPWSYDLSPANMPAPATQTYRAVPVPGEAQIILDAARGRLHVWGSSNSWRAAFPNGNDGLQLYFTSDDWGRTWQNRSS